MGMSLKKAVIISVFASSIFGSVAFAANTIESNNQVVKTVVNATTGLPFKDITNHWAKDTILWGVNNKVISGYPDGTFKPDAAVTEAEFLAMVIGAFRPNIPEVESQYWAEKYYVVAKELNYPVSQDVLIRNKPINRQRIAEIMAATQGKNYAGNDAIRFLYLKELSSGNDGKKTVEGYGATLNLTRAQAVQFLKNLKEKGLPQLQERPATPSDASQLPKYEETKPATTQPKLHLKAESKEHPENRFLLPRDSVSEPTIQAFIDSIKFENGYLIAKVPTNMPKGYTPKITIQGVGIRDVNPGQEIKQSISKTKGISFDVFKGNEGKNGVIIELPSGAYYWGSEK